LSISEEKASDAVFTQTAHSSRGNYKKLLKISPNIFLTIINRSGLRPGKDLG